MTRTPAGKYGTRIGCVILAGMIVWAVWPSGARGGGNLEAINQAGTAILNRFWDPQAYPVVWHENLGSPSFSNAHTPASAVHPALQDGFDIWEVLPTSSIDWSFGGSHLETDVGLDGINLITFVDSDVLAVDQGFTAAAPSSALTAPVTVTDASDGIIGNGVGILDLGGGLTFEFPVGNYPAGAIIDADLMYNTFGANADQFSTTGPDLGVILVDLLDVTVHEQGHMHGLSHSPLLSATMFPFTDILPINDAGSGPSDLELDDIASSSRYHPEAGFATDFGRIRGTVTIDGGQTADAVHVVAVDAATLEPVVSRFSISRFLDPADVIEEGEAFAFPAPSPFVLDGLPAGDYHVYIEYFDTSEPLDTRLHNNYNTSVLNSTVADGDPANPAGALNLLPQLTEFYDSLESDNGGNFSTPGAAIDNSDAAAVVSVQAGVETTIGDIAINLKTSGGGPPSQKVNPTARQTLERHTGTAFAGVLLDGGGNDFFAVRFLGSELPTPPYNIAEALWGRWGLSNLPYDSFLAFSKAGDANQPNISDPVLSPGRVITGGPNGQVAVGDIADVRDQWNFTVNSSRNLFFVIPQPASLPGISFLVEGYFVFLFRDDSPSGPSGHSLVTEDGGATDFQTLNLHDILYDLVIEEAPPVMLTGLTNSSVTQCTESVAMVLTGAGFNAPPAAIDLGQGITVTSVTVDSPTQISLTADILGPALGDQTISLRMPEVIFPNHARLLTVTGTSPNASDCDQDGTINEIDCDPFDGSRGEVPGEVTGVGVTANSDATISWDDQSATAGPTVVYDLVTGNLLDLRTDRDFSQATCLVDDTTAASFQDTRPDPNPGDGFYYIPRGQLSCGTGTYGTGNAIPNPRPDLDISGPCS